MNFISRSVPVNYAKATKNRFENPTAFPINHLMNSLFQMGNVLNKFGCSKHLEFPNGVVVNDRQEIFISDNRAHCVKVFNYEGSYLRQIGGEGEERNLCIPASPLGEMYSNIQNGWCCCCCAKGGVAVLHMAYKEQPLETLHGVFLLGRKVFFLSFFKKNSRGESEVRVGYALRGLWCGETQRGKAVWRVPCIFHALLLPKKKAPPAPHFSFPEIDKRK